MFPKYPLPVSPGHLGNNEGWVRPYGGEQTGSKSKRRSFGRIERRASGRYRAGFTAPDGRLYRAPSTFDTKDDAIAWLAARRAEIQLKVWAPDIVERSVAKKAVPTFEDYAKRWLSTRKTRGQPLRPTTRDHYEYLLESTLYPTFGKMPIDEITVEDVNDWYEKVAPGRESQRAHAYSLLRTILGTAASTRPKPLIPFNPAHIRGAGNVKPAHKVVPASLEELEVIVKNLPDRYRLMALFAAWCAMRFGELAELRRGDLDLKHNRIQIRRGVVRVRGEMIVGPPKTDAGIRDVAIPPHLIPAVEHHLDCARRAGAGRAALPGDGRLAPAHAAVDAVQGLLPGARDGRPQGPALARPPPHRRRPRRPDRRDPR